MFTTILVQPLFNLLAIIYAVLPGHDFGVAIILFTILVRLALWPLVNKQLHSQKALQQLAPEVAKVRAKAKGDRVKESQMLQELYKERGINPFASLLPLLIQLPIIFALFYVLRDMIKPGEIAHLAYPFTQHLPAIKDIVHGTSSFNSTFLGLANLAKANIVLAALAGAAQFFQSRQLMPKNQAGQSSETKAISSATVTIFPFITFFVGLSLPSALPLYWVTTSLVALFQQGRVLRTDARELEEKA
jgi:YidC/Oxa1 family membrane protein insertase